MTKQKFTDQQVTDLYSQNLSQAEIAQQLSVAQSTVHKRLIKLKLLKSTAKCNTKLYTVWRALKQRCYDENCASYKDYGARGIKVCAEWINSSEVFIEWAKSNGYAENLQIDRKDNDGYYEPSNCRFVDKHTNMSNRRMFKNNKSGYVGILWLESYNRWVVRVTIKGKRIHIGYTNTKKEAVEARNNYIINNNLHEYQIQEFIDVE